MECITIILRFVTKIPKSLHCQAQKRHPKVLDMGEYCLSFQVRQAYFITFHHTTYVIRMHLNLTSLGISSRRDLALIGYNYTNLRFQALLTCLANKFYFF
jgi:hypothetical protein